MTAGSEAPTAQRPSVHRRLFIALWPSDALRDRIYQSTYEAVQRCGGRVIPARNLHVTLVFLGAVAEAKIADALAVAALPVEPFEFRLGKLAWWKRQELLCLEPVGGEDALHSLVDRLRVALEKRGFDIERRPYRPHVTLARNIATEPAIAPIDELRWPVREIALVESRPLPNGSEYTLLRT